MFQRVEIALEKNFIQRNDNLREWKLRTYTFHDVLGHNKAFMNLQSPALYQVLLYATLNVGFASFCWEKYIFQWVDCAPEKNLNTVSYFSLYL